jgi:hypothetical protein
MLSSRERAPIALFVYNRVDLAQRTLDALAANIGAEQSDLIVFSDGPKSQQDAAQVTAVRSLISNTKGFRSVRLVEAPANRGLAPSVIAGVTATTQEHDHVIVMEDDLLTSPVFLDYMNDALNCYRGVDKVGAISGYTFPLPVDLPQTFFLPDESCWGWATWKRAWAKFEPDGTKLLREIRLQGRLREFDLYGSYPFCQMLEDQIAGRNSSWAIRWRASLFLNRMLSLYPGNSLVLNIGADGSGTHASKADTMFDVVLHQQPISVKMIPANEDAKINQALRRYFRRHVAYGPLGRVKHKLKRLGTRFFQAVGGR